MEIPFLNEIAWETKSLSKDEKNKDYRVARSLAVHLAKELDVPFQEG